MRFSGFSFAVLSIVSHGLLPQTIEAQTPLATQKENRPNRIEPAESLQTGLLLEPPLDLDWYTREKFVAACETIGAEKIRRPWKSPTTTLPEHPRTDASGLTEDEVKNYMRTAKRLFTEGKANPVSDVGLISTQEDVIRQPMLNHISAFENSSARVYLLVQKTESDRDWSYFSIVQDQTVEPALDYYGHIKAEGIKFEGTSCYKCHSSGPLAIHPAREDLVLDAALAAALSNYIAEQPTSRFHFPKDSPRPETGSPMRLDVCTACHEENGTRSPLYQVHSHSIRVLVDFGYMPPDERLSPREVTQLKAWLDAK